MAARSDDPPVEPQLSNRFVIEEHTVRNLADNGTHQVCRAYWVRGRHLQQITGAESASRHVLRRLVLSAYPDAVEVGRRTEMGGTSLRQPAGPLPESGPLSLSVRQIGRKISWALDRAALGQPVTVTKSGEPHAVIIGHEEYARLTGREGEE